MIISKNLGESIIVRGFLFCILLYFSSCYRQIIKSDAEIQKHYASKNYSPTFYQIDSLDKHIYIAQVGNDPTKPNLIMIHGAPGAWYGWMKQLDDTLLQSKFNMIAIDRLGYNKSVGNSYLNIDTQVLIVEWVLKKFNLGQANILVGRSYGSPIAAMVAAKNPSLVQATCLISSASDSALEKYFWFSPLGKNKMIQSLLPSAINRATEEKYAHPKQLAIAKKYYNQVTCKTTIIYGNKDWVANPQNSILLKNHMICNPRMVCVDHADHFISIKKPDIVRRELLNLLKNIR